MLELPVFEDGESSQRLGKHLSQGQTEQVPIAFLAPADPGEYTLCFQLGISYKGEITYFGAVATVTLVVKAKEPAKVFDPEEYKRLLKADTSIKKLG